jgi:hypothetical protein
MRRSVAARGVRRVARQAATIERSIPGERRVAIGRSARREGLGAQRKKDRIAFRQHGARGPACAIRARRAKREVRWRTAAGAERRGRDAEGNQPSFRRKRGRVDRLVERDGCAAYLPGGAATPTLTLELHTAAAGAQVFARARETRQAACLSFPAARCSERSALLGTVACQCPVATCAAVARSTMFVIRRRAARHEERSTQRDSEPNDRRIHEKISRHRQAIPLGPAKPQILGIQGPRIPDDSVAPRGVRCVAHGTAPFRRTISVERRAPIDRGAHREGLDA